MIKKKLRNGYFFKVKFISDIQERIIMSSASFFFKDFKGERNVFLSPRVNLRFIINY